VLVKAFGVFLDQREQSATGIFDSPGLFRKIGGAS
jgi:hypothetical protein